MSEWDDIKAQLPPRNRASVDVSESEAAAMLAAVLAPPQAMPAVRRMVEQIGVACLVLVCVAGTLADAFG